MPSKKQNQKTSFGEILAILAIITIIYGAFTNYPVINYIPQGTTEFLPLELNNGAQSYIQLKNNGGISVVITVNFSSDGSIRFRNDKKQIQDSSEVRYIVEPDNIVNFRFTPIINNTFKNATLIINYNSHIETFKKLKPKHSINSWMGVYEKSEVYVQGGTRWELR